MNSCTSALEIALKAAGIQGEVICPSFTWVATANSIVTAGATPVFCEVDPDSRNVTAETIAHHLGSRTEAVMVVHFGGQPCPMGEIVDLCSERGLLLIEDSAETLGATWEGRQAGSFGIGCFSFFPTKNITTGEGGMLTSSDDAFIRRVRTMISHGVSTSTYARERAERPWLRAAEMPGHNFRMSNILAAIGYYQLLRLEEMNARRQGLARAYETALGDHEAIRLPATIPGATHVYQTYSIRTEADRRDALVHHLRGRGVGASVHFDPPVHLQPAYLERAGGRGSLPATERLSSEVVTLPMYPDMTDEQVQTVADAVRTGV